MTTDSLRFDDWRIARPGAGLLVTGAVDALRAELTKQFDGIAEAASSSEMTIDEVEADGVPLLVAVPRSGEPVRGALMVVHGGGLVAGGPRFRLSELCARLSPLSIAVVLPQYRLAPEHPYPTPLDDVERAWRWTTSPDRGGAWPTLPRALMGGSAGGLLAAALMLRIRDKHLVPPSAVLLSQPMLDDRCESLSAREVVGGQRWDAESNRHAWELYASTTRDRTADFAPSRANDFSGLPPVFLEVAQADVLRDEALDFSSRLSHDGVPVELHMWQSASHGFEGEPGWETEAAWSSRLRYLSRLFDKP